METFIINAVSKEEKEDLALLHAMLQVNRNDKVSRESVKQILCKKYAKPS